ncbi:MAG: tRNA uridine-5-carboxymethylaminomethyl(34) synthesis enzyme MnmG [Clostridia bacterium]|nr:tRNA uridine-5-carboxymethylaminomethyl(34) synthesis enzyme MnmG [Clostridia bacterium]
MKTYKAGKINVAVIGAGHAGIEAALACARLGMETVLFTLSLDAVGNMPCNPAIGGTGKSHLVYEIDALGGEMGHAADCVTLQSRTLNLGKGPAVHSKRVQADRQAYRAYMKKVLENTPHLTLRQSQITEVLFSDEPDGSKTVRSVVTSYGAVWDADAVIVATGTYLDSRTITGEAIEKAGPDGMTSASGLSESLSDAGIRLMRFKTGTPPRIHADSIDFSKLEKQEGEKDAVPFSSITKEDEIPKGYDFPCYIAYTNEKTHEIIRNNIHLSPLFSGVIKGTGPRYCPSIEDKVTRFKDKTRHQLFVEPCGADTKEIYLQGFSSSLPEEVQVEMLHSIVGFENARIMRTAYAIEYDCADPLQLYPTLEFKNFHGLYGAGQFNGTSGYEEAAAQGLIAGINAANRIKGEEPLVLSRDSSYIGTLIDDLVTKGTNEPYRIMTSRSEYRLLLRQDNADERLTEYGYKVGLINGERYRRFLDKMEMIKAERERVENTWFSPDKVNGFLESKGLSKASNGVSLADLLRRPGIDYQSLKEIDAGRPDGIPASVGQAVEISMKYDGYIRRQLAEVARNRKLEEKLLPDDIDYNSIIGLRIEARQKLGFIRPCNIGQASRISGVSPADISVLLVWLEGRRGE